MVDIERVRELKNSGMSYAEVADQVGVSRQRIAQLLMNKKVRAELIVKSGGRCEGCGRESDHLQAHHTDYNSGPDVALCVRCHKQVHDGVLVEDIVPPTFDELLNGSSLTNAQKQSRRVTELNAIAQAAGWCSIGTALTALKRNVIKLPCKPDDYDDRPTQRKQSSASRANPLTRAGGRRGGRPKKEQAK